MQRNRIYECMCLLDNREVRKGWQPLKESVTALFQKRGAEVVSARRWDERRLAYPIKAQQRATYMLAYLRADTQQVAGIRRDLQFSEAVLRSLVLQCQEVPQSAYEPEADFDVNAIPVDEAPASARPVHAAEGPEEVRIEPAEVGTEEGEKGAKAGDEGKEADER